VAGVPAAPCSGSVRGVGLAGLSLYSCPGADREGSLAAKRLRLDEERQANQDWPSNLCCVWRGGGELSRSSAANYRAWPSTPELEPAGVFLSGYPKPRPSSGSNWSCPVRQSLGRTPSPAFPAWSGGSGAPGAPRSSPRLNLVRRHHDAWAEDSAPHAHFLRGKCEGGADSSRNRYPAGLRFKVGIGRLQIPADPALFSSERANRQQVTRWERPWIYFCPVSVHRKAN
jgi:hypothetical protein